MKIGLIGFGYWGKIILKNLENIGEKNIVICDTNFPTNGSDIKYETISDYKDLDAIVFL